MNKEEYQRQYQRMRYAEGRNLRAKWIADNGPCKGCGTWERLVVDHVDPKTKSFQTSAIWMAGEARRMVELAKCQVLCVSCHGSKSTAVDRIIMRTRCRRGHEYTPENTAYDTTYGRRLCRTCYAAKVDRIRKAARIDSVLREVACV